MVGGAPDEDRTVPRAPAADLPAPSPEQPSAELQEPAEGAHADQTRHQVPRRSPAPTPDPDPEPTRPGVGESAIALEWVKCGAFDVNLRFFTGEVVAGGEDGFTIAILERYAAKFTPDAVGLDASQWWCIPRARYCYEEVAFEDWDGPRAAGDRFRAAPNEVFSSSWGIERAVQSVVDERCSS